MDARDGQQGAPSSQGGTLAEMRNVDFRATESVILEIRTLLGALLSAKGDDAPVLNDKGSFVLRIDEAEIGLGVDSITHLMNEHVLAYPEAPLRNVQISTQGDMLRMDASLIKIIEIPIEIVGTLTATSAGTMRLRPVSIKAAGVPVDGLLELIGLDIADIINLNHARGLRLDGDDIFLDPRQMLPPPKISGHLHDVQVEQGRIVLRFLSSEATPGAGRAALRLLAPDAPNYIYFQGGTLCLGTVTLSDVRLQIVDMEPNDPFDFFLDHLPDQLAAGSVKIDHGWAMLVSMPDFHRLGRQPQGPRT